MTHYCSRCGHFGLLDLITFWCSDCVSFWRDQIQTTREKAA